jgi:hypothetical protein
MRLIDTRSYSLVEVNSPEDHPYAILSHTWSEKGEVSFEDMKDLDVAKTRTAWSKVERTCALAVSQRLDFAWIDTCCIDKSSSAELTEAINSMFGWYQKAQVCYTYLIDLPAFRPGSPSDDSGPESAEAVAHAKAKMRYSLWFTRGWTLQELIAPKNVEFYDRAWNKRGTKASLQIDISLITRIDVTVLDDIEELAAVPVARRMSWAAGRKTTRVEDIAYSLLGIFDVNIPLIYGEGARAFIRLQEAIAESTSDLSLFAWCAPEADRKKQLYHGILAQSPAQFIRCRQLEHVADPLRHDRQYFTMTNRGVEFQTSLMTTKDDDYLMPLFCRDSPIKSAEEFDHMLAIRLVKTSSGFVRHSAVDMFVYGDNSTDSVIPTDRWDPFMRSVHLPRLVTVAESKRLNQRFRNAFRFRIDTTQVPGVKWEISTHDVRIKEEGRDPASLRPSYWDPATLTVLTDGYEHFTGMLYIKFSFWSSPFILMCGLWPQHKDSAGTVSNTEEKARPWIAFLPPSDLSDKQKGHMDKASWRRLRELTGIVSQKTSMHYPQFLARAGHLIRDSLARGRVFPTAAVVEPLDRQVTRASVETEKASRLHVVTISVERANV